MELQIVNTRKNLAVTQEIPDSLGVISFQEIERSPQHLSYPLLSPKHKITPADIISASSDTIPALDTVAAPAQLSTVKTIAAPAKTYNSQIEFPFAHSNSYNPDFTLKLFDHQGAIAMNQRNFGAHPTFSQDFKEQVFTINYKKINDTSNNWFFWIIFGSIALLCVARIRYRKRFDLFLSSIFHYNLLLKTIRNANESNNQLSALLQVLFTLNTSLFIYQTVNYFNPLQLPGLQNIALVCAGAVLLFILYGAKSLMLKGLGAIYMCRDFAHEYLFNVHLYNKALGIFLFPVIICFAFVQPHIISHGTIMTIGFILIAFFYLLRIARGVIISVKSGISLFYVFLFLCILEFLPLLLLAKATTILLHSLSL
ncbi:MAG: DUF4271 domain-containing protein [Bacteroidetes bacterium]|nr:DUF4271 domain-containing protein [Bacteroidota bacterium]